VAIAALLVLAPAVGAASTATAGTDLDEPAETVAAEAGALPADPDGSTQTSEVGAAGFTWQLLSHEYCLDRFGTTCPNGATSADPCPVSAPQGKPCSIPWDRCWSVLSTWWADEYRCQ
jgi:hypothetical protein